MAFRYIITSLFVLLISISTTACAFQPPPPGLPSYQQLLTHIDNESARYGVPTAAIKAVIKNESAWKNHAVSRAGAQGLMQLMPDTARRFGVRNAFDPLQNVTGGTRYLAWLQKEFKGDWVKTFAGYNAGEGRIYQYGGVPPFAETRNYVNKVMADFSTYSRWNGQNPTNYAQAQAYPMQANKPRGSGKAPSVYRVAFHAANAPTTVQWQPPVNYYQ